MRGCSPAGCGATPCVSDMQSEPGPSDKPQPVLWATKARGMVCSPAKNILSAVCCAARGPAGRFRPDRSPLAPITVSLYSIHDYCIKQQVRRFSRRAHLGDSTWLDRWLGMELGHG